MASIIGFVVIGILGAILQHILITAISFSLALCSVIFGVWFVMIERKESGYRHHLIMNATNQKELKLATQTFSPKTKTNDLLDNDLL